MRALIAIYMQLVLPLGLIALFFFMLYRVMHKILADGQFFLSELVLGVLFVGLITAIAMNRFVTTSVIMEQDSFVMILFMFFILVSVLAGTACALHDLKKKNITCQRLRKYYLLIYWSLTCGPWLCILYALIKIG